VAVFSESIGYLYLRQKLTLTLRFESHVHAVLTKCPLKQISTFKVSTTSTKQLEK